MLNLPPDVAVCEWTGGGIRLTGLREVDFETLQEEAAKANKVVQLDAGLVTVYPESADPIADTVLDSLANLKEFTDASTETIEESGALAFHTLQRPTANCTTLLAVLRFPNVLKITIDDLFLTVQVLLPSQIKHGIAYQKRTGALNRAKRMKRVWPVAFPHRRNRHNTAMSRFGSLFARG